ncbi:uncharacterized protein LOC118746553 [Rhagoletis pomonella]|uniref:uncharacterized protein LOC118746553 n=1 Tax=Rhagoletis pomonella TaxID=28610 RepID=UPI00177BFB2F|nr:uncharacterized protein LOC118746553 [Rhagoletis pomonella]
MESATLNIDGHSIKTQQSLKYLGVMIDSRLSYKVHIGKACEKAARVTTALTRLMANIGGPIQNRRALLAKVSQSILMYAAPIWGPALQRKTYAKAAKSVFRLNSIRVTSAFRTVPHEAVGVLAGIMRPEIMAMELKRVFDKSRNLGRTRIYLETPKVMVDISSASTFNGSHATASGYTLDIGILQNK